MIGLLPCFMVYLLSGCVQPLSVFEGNESTSVVELFPAFLSIVLFALLLIVILSSLVYLFHRWRRQQLSKAAEQLEQAVTQRTALLNSRLLSCEQQLSKNQQLFTEFTDQLNIPLTLIAGPLEAQLKYTVDEPTTARLSLARVNASRVLSMLAHWRELNEATTLAVLSAAKPQNVLQICHFIFDAFRSPAQLRGIKVALLIEADHDLTVCMADGGLEKVVSGLLVYAFDHADNKIRLRVSHSNQEMLKLEVRGFKGAEVVEHTSGLKVVNALVESYQGTLSLNSGVLRVVLPLSVVTEMVEQPLNHAAIAPIVEQQMSVAYAQEQGEKSDESDVRETILIVENTQELRAYLQSLLEAHCICYAVSNGLQGLPLALEVMPDLIICEAMMPSMTGYEFTRAIRHDERSRHIPVILLSNDNHLAQRIQAWQEKADALMTKPFNSEELLARVHGLLSITGRSRPVSVKVKKARLADKALSKQQLEEKLRRILNRNYREPDYDVEALAKNMVTSRRHLGRTMKLLLAVSPSDYIRLFRLEKAAELLKRGQAPNVVAINTGFSSHSHFTKCFSDHYHLLPSQYRHCVS